MKSLTDPRPGRHPRRTSAEKSEKKEIRHLRVYIYIDDPCQKNSSPNGDDTFADSTGAVSGISFAIFRRPWRNRGICRRLFTAGVNFAHPSYNTRRLFARTDRSMMYGIRFLLAPLTIPPGPFVLSSSPLSSFLFLFARTGVRRDEFRVNAGLSDVLAIFIDFSHFSQ